MASREQVARHEFYKDDSVLANYMSVQRGVVDEDGFVSKSWDLSEFVESAMQISDEEWELISDCGIPWCCGAYGCSQPMCGL